MQNAIKAEIKRLAQRAFVKKAKKQELIEKYQRQFEKRTGTPAKSSPEKTPHFKTKHFDPVYCARNANFLSKTIWHKIIEKSYEPIPAIKYSIPKPDGSKRSIMVFSIPDAALANVVLRRTRGRNIKRLSPSSYAYHPDKNVFDAIIALREYESEGKMFAVQIDFEKYFDNIPAWYLNKKIKDAQKISLTPHERFIFGRFLHHRYASYDQYDKGKFQRRIHGISQGSSISLLLANLANHDLDTQLSGSSGMFVRFADDVVALCGNYSEALQLEKCFVAHCRNSGLAINPKKSPGIAIISQQPQELRTLSEFDYLGYRFLPHGLSVPIKVKARIRYRISRLIHIYLLRYLSYGYNASRAAVSPYQYDWDLLGLIYELRRSLYGGLSEDDLSGFLFEGKKLKRMKGLMGFYCLIDSPEVLREIDGWMLSMVRRAMVKRKLKLGKYNCYCPTPTNAQLATGKWLNPLAWRDNDLPEAKMPSLVRGWRAARKHYFTFGLEHVEAPNYGFYAGISELF